MTDLELALSLVCVLQTICIVWLIYVNSTVLAEKRALDELLADTGAIPLFDTHLQERAANDRRP